MLGIPSLRCTSLNRVDSKSSSPRACVPKSQLLSTRQVCNERKLASVCPEHPVLAFKPFPHSMHFRPRLPPFLVPNHVEPRKRSICQGKVESKKVLSEDFPPLRTVQKGFLFHGVSPLKANESPTFKLHLLSICKFIARNKRPLGVSLDGHTE